MRDVGGKLDGDVTLECDLAPRPREPTETGLQGDGWSTAGKPINSWAALDGDASPHHHGQRPGVTTSCVASALALVSV